jgi:hypothetical protein
LSVQKKIEILFGIYKFFFCHLQISPVTKP